MSVNMYGAEFKGLSGDQINQFQATLKLILDNWEKIRPATSWFSNHQALTVAFQYVVDGIDKFVDLAAQLSVPGQDKKVLVLSLANRLFDGIVTPLLPIWLPAALVKSIFNGILSGVIEFLVSKLKS